MILLLIFLTVRKLQRRPAIFFKYALGAHYVDYPVKESTEMKQFNVPYW